MGGYIWLLHLTRQSHVRVLRISICCAYFLGRKWDVRLRARWENNKSGHDWLRPAFLEAAADLQKFELAWTEIVLCAQTKTKKATTTQAHTLRGILSYIVKRGNSLRYYYPMVYRLKLNNGLTVGRLRIRHLFVQKDWFLRLPTSLSRLFVWCVGPGFIIIIAGSHRDGKLLTRLGVLRLYADETTDFCGSYRHGTFLFFPSLTRQGSSFPSSTTWAITAMAMTSR